MAEEETANDPQLLGLLHLAWDTAVFTVKPMAIGIGNAIYYIAFALTFVLRLLWRPLEFILLPLFYLGDFVLTCLLAPFRFLAKFETLYIYLGIAALIGAAGGLIISLISGGLQSLLGLNSQDEPGGRTLKDYRKARRKRNAPSDVSSASSASDFAQALSGVKSGRRSRRSGKSSGKPPTILEELDSDY